MQDISGMRADWVTKPEDMNLLNELIGIESTYEPEEAKSSSHWGWKPYPLGKFGGLMQAAVNAWDRGNGVEARPLFFLEVGCGIGTKLVLARKLFGVATFGIDIDPAMLHVADELATSYECSITTWEADASTFGPYSTYDVVFLNRPFRDTEMERDLEAKIFEDMDLGSVVILGNSITIPMGWEQVAQDVVATVWRKVCWCEKAEQNLRVDLLGQASGANTVCTLCGREFAIDELGDGSQLP